MKDGMTIADPMRPDGLAHGYKHLFVVEGTGRVPADMMRYDGAMVWTGLLFDETQRRVVLATKDVCAPHVARWESFGWRVVEAPMGHAISATEPQAAQPAPKRLAPTWAGILPLLLGSLEDGSPQTRALVKAELQEMARLADLAVEQSTD